MASLEELKEERINKLNILKEKGINPYPSSTSRTHRIAEVLDDFDNLAEIETSITLAGRILSIREHGGSIFFDIYDGSGEIQLYLKKDNVDEESFDLFIETIDMGDFIEASGTVFTTKTEQQSLSVESWGVLSKSLRPLPDQWYGLENKEKRLRRRYLDVLFNEEVREMIEKRAVFFRSMREFLEKKDFMEVQTPILETVPGGADAKPFVSHHNALDLEVYLRISAGELWQKKMMVGGFERVFEIGRVFRNEGISPEHAQDYMQMEFYWAYADFKGGMKLVEEMYKYIAKETFGTLQFNIHGHEVDLSKQWEIYDYKETILDIVDIDITSVTLNRLMSTLDDLSVSYEKENLNKVRAIDTLWKYCRKKITGPGFLVGVPSELSPLAKESESENGIVEQFQPIIAGSEVGKGYSELNDPQEQARRFEKQEQMRSEGDEEAQRYDRDFVEALEYGMPPTCGFGVSERLFAFLTDLPIREAQIFPLLRPKD